MMNNYNISTLCVLGALTLPACGDPTAFEEAPLETPERIPDEAEGEVPEVAPGTGSPGRVATAFDVAEDNTRFAFDEGPLDEDGLPEHGNSFVTQGYIYPFGFLDGREGTDENGAPAHPEHVIGEWTCWGYFVGDGAASESGVWAVSTQIYDFYVEPGYAEDKAPSKHTVVSEGHEPARMHGIVTRSITGATGLAKAAEGELVQMLDGTNETGGVNLSAFIGHGFDPLIAPEDLPDPPPRDRESCDFDLFSGERCPLF